MASLRQCTGACPCATTANTPLFRRYCHPEPALGSLRTRDGAVSGSPRLPVLKLAQRRRQHMKAHASSDNAPAAFANSQLSERDSLKTQLIRCLLHCDMPSNAGLFFTRPLMRPGPHCAGLLPIHSGGKWRRRHSRRRSCRQPRRWRP